MELWFGMKPCRLRLPSRIFPTLLLINLCPAHTQGSAVEAWHRHQKEGQKPGETRAVWVLHLKWQPHVRVDYPFFFRIWWILQLNPAKTLVVLDWPRQESLPAAEAGDAGESGKAWTSRAAFSLDRFSRLRHFQCRHLLILCSWTIFKEMLWWSCGSDGLGWSPAVWDCLAGSSVTLLQLVPCLHARLNHLNVTQGARQRATTRWDRDDTGSMDSPSILMNNFSKVAFWDKIFRCWDILTLGCKCSNP